MNQSQRLPLGGTILIPGLPPIQIPGGQLPWVNQPGGGPMPGFPQLPPGNNQIFFNIKSVIENRFVVVGPNNRLYATEQRALNSQVFRMIMQNNNTVKLRLRGSSFIRLDRNDMLVADTNNQGATLFRVFQSGRDEYVLQAPNGRYVRVRDNDKVLIARADNPGPRTRFKFRSVTN